MTIESFGREAADVEGGYDVRLLDDAGRVVDPLTGLGNRRRLTAELETALARPPAGESLALIIYDLDGFKLYNDAFGHPASSSVRWRAVAARTGWAATSSACSRASAIARGSPRSSQGPCSRSPRRGRASRSARPTALC